MVNNDRRRDTVVVSILLLSAAYQLHAQSLPQWKWQNPQPQGDYIREIKFVDSLHGWITLPSNSILRTTDGGATWQLHRLQKNLRRISFVSHALGWAIGADDYYRTRVGIYKTDDGGLTWQQQLPDTTVLTDDILFTDPMHGWALGGDIWGTLWHTSDGGVNWYEQAGREFVRNPGTGHRLSFRDSLTGWAGGWGFYVSKTTNGGATWSRDSTLGGYNKFVFVDSLNGWACRNYESSEHVPVARSSDGGFTWTPTPTQLIADVHPVSPARCIAYTPQGVVQTIDGGATWTTISVRAFEAGTVSSASTYWARESNSFRFHQSTNYGVDWFDKTIDAFQMVGGGFTRLWAVDFVDTLNGWVVGSTLITNPGNSFVARTTNGGQNWQRITEGLPSEPLKLSFINRSTGWIIGREELIWKTTDSGFTWRQQRSGPIYTFWGVSFPDSLHGYVTGAQPPQGPGVILKSTNGGEQWTDVTPPGIPGLGTVQFVDSLYGWTSGTSVFLRTTNGGLTWSTLGTPSVLYIDAFFFLDRGRGWGYGPYSVDPNVTLLLKTTDGGVTWFEQRRDSSRGLFLGSVKFADSLVGWMVGGSGSIWFTSNGGDTWHDNSGVTSASLKGLGVVSPSKAWIVGYQGTILAYDSDGTVSVPEETIFPTGDVLRIFPNYPNPFNSQTIISYRLGASGSVTLDLYDILGRKVKTTAEGRREPGDHRIVITANDLASGVYLFIINSGTTSLGGKIVLIR